MTSLSFSRNFSLIFCKVFLKFLPLSRDAKSVSEWSLIVEGYFAGKSLYFLYFTAIKKHLSPLINKHLKFLLTKATVPFQMFGNNYWREELTLDEIQNKLENLTDKDEVTHVNFVSDWGFRHPNRGEYLITQHEQMKEEAKIILGFSPYVEDSLYLLVTDIMLSWYNDYIWHLKLFIRLPNKYSLKFLAAEVYDYKNILIQLKEYLEKIN